MGTDATFDWDETTVSSALDIAMEVDAACDPEAGDLDACEALCDGRLCCFEEGAGSCLGDPAKACLEYRGARACSRIPSERNAGMRDWEGDRAVGCGVISGWKDLVGANITMKANTQLNRNSAKET